MDTPAEYARVATVYAAVYDLASGARAARLAELCGDDADLRRQVEELLAASDALGPAGVSTSLGAVDPALLDAAAPAVRFEAGDIAAGRYRVAALAGRGGAGEVYCAEDLLLRQTVALKFLSRGARERERAAALLNEVRLARRVRHPNVCQIFDVGEAQGERFLSMEYIRGADLARELRRIGRFAHPKAVHVAHQLCAGLAAIHQQGIVHGDLKPANVMLDENGDVRIVDFGISEARQWTPSPADDEERAGTRAGTPAYAPPERWRGEPVSVSSDLYSLGLVLYEVFTGARAIEADGAAAYREQHESAIPLPMSSRIYDVEPAVEAIVERCLAKRPEERPASVLEVARALPGGDALGGLVLAGILPSAERVAEGTSEPRPARRATIALAILFVVLLGAAASLIPRAYLVEASDLPLAPVALADRAATLLRALGCRDLPYRAWGFGVFDDQPEVLFWYRGSPRPLEAMEIETGVALSDPPLTEDGMVAVVLKPTGELRSFVALGAAAFAERVPMAEAESELFDAAGLERADFAAADSSQPRYLGRGEGLAWAARAGAAATVAASAEDGRLVSFEVVEPGRMSLWSTGQPRATARRAFGPFTRWLALASVVAATVLGWRNLRRGAVDRLGARRTAVTVLFLALALAAANLLGAGVATISLRFLLFELGQAALFATSTWILYAALEPLFRRYWPHGLVTWTRLVRARFRDPLLGRDLVVGACLGATGLIFEALRVWAAHAFAGHALLTPTIEQARALGGPWGAVGAVLAGFLGAIILSWVQFSLLVLVRTLVGAGAILVVGYAAVMATGSTLFDDAPWWTAAFRLAFWLIATPIVVRSGFTVMATTAFVFFALADLPLTLDPRQWYFPTSVGGYGLLLALAGYGAWACLVARERRD